MADESVPSNPPADAVPIDQSVPPADDVTPHVMRIASQGKLHSYVTFALRFLQEPHRRPLILHTLPYKPPAPSETPAPPEKSKNPGVPSEKDNETTAKNSAPVRLQERKGLPASTATIPRLVSVVEIIKREFAEVMAKRPVNDRMMLHQYNALGCLEDLEQTDGTEMEVDGSEQVQVDLLTLLEGKNHLKIKRTPYMKVTLTLSPFEAHDPKQSTYQGAVAPKRLSKSARGRARKKRKKEAIAAAAAAAPTGRDSSSGEEEA